MSWRSLALWRSPVRALLVGAAAAGAVSSPAAAASRPMSFEERVDCRVAIEDVLWAHRSWPAANATAKPPREVVLPRSAIAARVAESLRYEAALARRAGRDIGAAEIQAEMDRQTRDTRDPDMLRELRAALGDDPYRVAECLVRPELVERQFRTWFAQAPGVHSATRARALADLTGAASLAELGAKGVRVESADWVRSDAASDRGGPGAVPGEVRLDAGAWAAATEELAGAFGVAAPALPMARPADAPGRRALARVPLGRPSALLEDGERFYVRGLAARAPGRLRVETAVWPKETFESWWSRVRASYPAALPAAAAYTVSPVGAGGCTDDTWQDTPGLRGAPSSRVYHSAVWTGSEMIVWGGGGAHGNIATGARYVPSTDTWTPMSTLNAPAGRQHTRMVWTGTEVLVWGGYNGGYLDSGGRYTPSTDTWQPMTQTGAPAGRYLHAAVWTGSALLVWGGNAGGSSFLATGGRYDPAADAWSPISTVNAPSARYALTATWTGSEMVVWGGVGAGPSYPVSGGRYAPATDTWTATSTVNAPIGRANATAVWAGDRVIVWGGTAGFDTGTGGVYVPATDTWTPTSNTQAPVGRNAHSAVWTGSEMIVFGGSSGGTPVNSGGRYTPSSDTWKAIDTSTAPAARYGQTAVWTGNEMVVWGGYGGAYLATGGRYLPFANSWLPTAAGVGPTGRTNHASVWTGSEMIVWGGGLLTSSSGGRYSPATDSWLPTSTAGAPSPRWTSGAAWTGTEMLVWGGYNAGYLATGGRYDPTADHWTAIETAGAPEARWAHTTVWTGSQMLIWGGITSNGRTRTGALYVPASGVWTPMNDVTAPEARWSHTAVWTGKEMIVWGGMNNSALATGGRYDPATDGWTATSTALAPAARMYHTAVWTGAEMIVWGGKGAASALASGGRYNPASDTWLDTSPTGAPTARYQHSAVWTGAEMLVWGGTDTTSRHWNTGGRYAAASGGWAPIATFGAPVPRALHTALWTGARFLVWGGEDGGYLDGGGSYCADAPQSPAFVSAATATFHVGRPGAFVVSTTGSPWPAILPVGTLPSGLSFVDHGDGTGTFSGTPAVGTDGQYGLLLSASNGFGGDAQQSFTLIVDSAPEFTGTNRASFVLGANGTFTVTTVGNPQAAIALTGALPSGVTFTNRGDGTATIAGKPGPGTVGTYLVTLTASNGVGSAAKQTFALVVTGDSFFTVTPCRVFDSRLAANGPALASGEVRLIQIGGACGVSPSAKAAALNITVVSPSGTGEIAVVPGNIGAPGTSTASFAAGRTRANNTLIGLAGSGPVGTVAAVLAIPGNGTAHLVVDVTGYVE